MALEIKHAHQTGVGGSNGRWVGGLAEWNRHGV